MIEPHLRRLANAKDRFKAKRVERLLLQAKRTGKHDWGTGAVEVALPLSQLTQNPDTADCPMFQIADKLSLDSFRLGLKRCLTIDCYRQRNQRSKITDDIVNLGMKRLTIK